MKKQQLNEIKGKSVKDLKAQVKNFKKEIANLTIDLKLGKLKNLRAISTKKRDIAQTLTIVNQKLVLEKIAKDKKEA